MFFMNTVEPAPMKVILGCHVLLVISERMECSRLDLERGPDEPLGVVGLARWS